MNQKIKFGIYYIEEFEGIEEMKEVFKLEVVEEILVKLFIMFDVEQFDFRVVLKFKV